MAHVVFRVGDAAQNGKGAELIVDGLDITDHVLAGGVAIGATGDGEFDEWFVKVTLAVDKLEVEIPDASLAGEPAGAPRKFCERGDN